MENCKKKKGSNLNNFSIVRYILNQKIYYQLGHVLLILKNQKIILVSMKNIFNYKL